MGTAASNPYREWAKTAVMGLLMFVGASLAFVCALWVLQEVVGDSGREIKIAAAFVIGLAFLLAVIASIVAAFAAMKLTSDKSALGLPEGSIRAIIALVLVLIFVIMAVYLIEAVFTKRTSDEATNAATQLLATLGTLVAAVAAFYFGTSAVTTGAKAVTQAANASRPSPTAITKGSMHRDNEYWLVGHVNPNGPEANWYFQYGADNAYGQSTPVSTLGAGTTEQKVEAKAPQIQTGWHFRLVAFNDSGTNYGEDEAVTDEPTTVPDEEQEAVVQDLAAVVEDQAAVVEDQAAVVEDQAAVVEDQAAVVEDQAAVVEDQAAVVEDQTPGAEEKPPDEPT